MNGLSNLYCVLDLSRGAPWCGVVGLGSLRLMFMHEQRRAPLLFSSPDEVLILIGTN